jgi:hypothetical protein
MKRFTYWRNAIVAETYIFEAESEEAALEMLQNGEVEVFSEEWVDWANGGYELEDVEELDPLYVMVKGYKSVDNLVE